jgi:hypothetical protein
MLANRATLSIIKVDGRTPEQGIAGLEPFKLHFLSEKPLPKKSLLDEVVVYQIPQSQIEARGRRNPQLLVSCRYLKIISRSGKS